MTVIKPLLLVCSLLCAVHSIRSATIRTATSATDEATPKPSSASTGSDSRTENARSLDISKYTSTDFHNKLYDAEVSSEKQRITATAASSTENLQLTTSANNRVFDEKLKILVSKKRTSSNNAEEQVEKPNATNFEFVRYANVLDESHKEKNSVHKAYELEKGLNLNFESVYNDTKFLGDDSTTVSNDKISNISKREKLVTTSTVSNTLPSLEAMEPTKKDPTLVENNIYPVLVPIPVTTASPPLITTSEHFERLFEMTENDADVTTALFSTTTSDSKETFFEMTDDEIATSESNFETTTSDESSTKLPTTTEFDESVTATESTTFNTMVPPDVTTEFTTEEIPTMVPTDALNTMPTTVQTTTESETEPTTLANYIPKDSTSMKIITNDIKQETSTVPVTINATGDPGDMDETNEDLTDDEYIDLQNRKAKQSLNTVSPSIITSRTEKVPSVVTIAVSTSVVTTESTIATTEELGHANDGDIDENNSGTVLAIVLSSVGAICLILLAILLFVMRRRQRRFNYGQRCTPVSLDSYSMDNVSVYNSVRRKNNVRSSKRSYGNPAFDDTTVSHPLNFQALLKFASNEEDVKAEFEEIPQVHAKMNELPEGCETKNRYANVIPLPETRVFLKILSNKENDRNSDYINANYVTGPKGVRNYYIACQAPMENTVNDFWRMVWEQQSKVILMITHLFENGIEKCIDYLPPSEVSDCHRLFGDFQVTLKKREIKDKYIISSLQLKNMVSNSWREVTHMWYLGWPETGAPQEESSLIAFLIEARSFVKLVTNSETKESSLNEGKFRTESSPVIVHCSPGTGRTGTVIACDIAIREFELRRNVDIPKIVYKIRRDRASSVQTKDQYQFIYKVIALYATKLTGGSLDSL